jgi:hypothetical protein
MKLISVTDGKASVMHELDMQDMLRELTGQVAASTSPITDDDLRVSR